MSAARAGNSGGDVERLASELLDAFDERRMIPLLSSTTPGFDSDAAYAVLDRIDEHRRGRGWQRVGRKIGFTNQGLWARYGVDRPMWASMWDHTLLGPGGARTVDLSMFVQPRIEPEIVVCLRGPLPVVDDPIEILRSVEWVAPGFEVVQCLFVDWRFTAADCTAAFGLHGALAVGDPVPVDLLDATDVVRALADFEITLSRDGEVVDRGAGSNVLGSPLLALAHLVRGLAERGDVLDEGDIVTTGTLTDAWPLTVAATWSASYSGAPFDTFTLSVA